MTLERRQTVRDSVCLAAFASIEGAGASTILNLSEAGMGLQATSPLPAGESSAPSEVRLSLDLPATQTSIEARGVIAWSDPALRAGVRFLNLAEGQRRLLHEFLSLNAAAEERKTPTDVPLQDALAIPTGTACSSGVHAAATLEEEPAAAASIEAATPSEAVKERDISDLALRVVADRARVFTGATGAAVALLEGDAMLCRAASGESVPPVGARLGLGSGISAECVRTRAVLRCDDAETDPGVDRESCRALGIRSIVVVPVMQGPKVVGVLEVVSSAPNAFANYDQAGLQRIIEQILTGRSPQPAANPTGNHPANASATGFVDEPSADAEDDHTPIALDQSAAPSGMVELLENLRRPDSWLMRNRILLGALAGTVLGLIILSVSAKLQHHATAGVDTSAPAAIARQQVAPLSQASGPELKKQILKRLSELEQLARSGDAAAQFSLGARYATGDQVQQDYAEAVKWFAKSAEQGHIVSQAALGACYWAGRGVPQDYVRSYMWSSLAKLGGDEASKYRVTVLRPRMSSAQIAEADRLVQIWLRDHPERAARFSPSAQLQP